MMISEQDYISRHENDTFEELIKERNSLVNRIIELEKIVYSEDKTGEEWMICPGPDVQYQMYLEYLAELCKLLGSKYNGEVAWKGILKR